MWLYARRLTMRINEVQSARPGEARMVMYVTVSMGRGTLRSYRCLQNSDVLRIHLRLTRCIEGNDACAPTLESVTSHARIWSSNLNACRPERRSTRSSAVKNPDL